MRFSLRTKAILLIVLFAVVLGGVGLLVSMRLIDDVVESQYKTDADQMALTVSHILDGDEVRVVRDQVMSIYSETGDKVGLSAIGTPAFSNYTSLFLRIMNTSEYQELYSRLMRIRVDNDLECVCLIYADPVTSNEVYLVDTDKEDPFTPGVFEPVEEVNYESLKKPERGYPAYFKDGRKELLLSAAAPVFDSTGRMVAYVAIDVSMDIIRAQQTEYCFRIMLVMIFLTMVICLIGFFLVNRHIVKPIRRLSVAARGFCKKGEKDIRIGFDDLHIRSHDEIGELADSMKQMERELQQYIENLIQTREQLVLSRERATEMSNMANKDPLTGLRNKRAFDLDSTVLDDDIRVRQAEFGIVMIDMNFLKKINDSYGHDKGDVAISMTSRIICDIFKHSPVYRVGGDEFVVILKNTDYRDINQLLRRFKESVRQKTDNTLLNPWERISAAIGFAIYDENIDSSAGDVYERADAKMYEDKHRMKAEMNHGT